MEYTLEDYNNAVAEAEAKAVYDIAYAYDQAEIFFIRARAEARAVRDPENAVFKQAIARARAVRDEAYAEARAVYDEAGDEARAEARAVRAEAADAAGTVYRNALANAKAVRDSVIAEARARLAGDNLRALIRQEERDNEIIE